jgi:beta-lactamase regulating signal transducer with metallopeptidase domain
MLILSLLGLAARSAGLLIVTLFLSLVLKPASASIRRLVWIAGILSVLLMPLAWRVAPEAPVAPEAIPGYMPAIQTPVVSNAIDQFIELTQAAPEIDRQEASTILPASKPVNPLTVFMIAWAVLTTVFLVRLIIGLIWARWVVVKAKPFHFAGIERSKAALGLRRGVLLLVSDRLSVPATTGWRRPVVILPEEAHVWTDAKTRMMLAHEFAHIRQNDWIFTIVAQIVCAIYPFNPLVWLAAHRLRVESELTADDRVLSTGLPPKAYAEGLLEIARSARAVSPNMVAIARSPRVEARVRAIVALNRRRGVAAVAIVGLSGVLATAACTGIAAFRIGEPSTEYPQTGAAVAISPDGPVGWKGPLTVHVLDPNGNPCPGARLCFGMQSPGIYATGTADPEPVTDRNGNYQVRPDRLTDLYYLDDRFLKIASLVEVTAYHPGYAMTASDFIKEGTGQLTIRLGRSNLVRIPVLGPNGAPAAGITLTASQMQIDHSGHMFIPPEWRVGAFRSVSDSRGFAEFHDIPTGWSVKIEINDDRFLPTARRQENPPVSGTTQYPPVHLAVGAILEGAAYVDGKPVKGLSVQANGAGPVLPRVSHTGADGRYRIGQVPPGVCDVHCYPTIAQFNGVLKHLVAKQHNGLHLAPGQTVSGVDFNFESGGVVTGHVFDKHGKPTQYLVAVVAPDFVQFRDGIATNPADFDCMSDPKDGSYTIRIPAGHFRVGLGGPESPMRDIYIKKGETVVADFRTQY